MIRLPPGPYNISDTAALTMADEHLRVLGVQVELREPVNGFTLAALLQMLVPGLPELHTHFQSGRIQISPEDAWRSELSAMAERLCGGFTPSTIVTETQYSEAPMLALDVHLIEPCRLFFRTPHVQMSARSLVCWADLIVGRLEVKAGRCELQEWEEVLVLCRKRAAATLVSKHDSVKVERLQDLARIPVHPPGKPPTWVRRDGQPWTDRALSAWWRLDRGQTEAVDTSARVGRASRPLWMLATLGERMLEGSETALIHLTTDTHERVPGVSLLTAGAFVGGLPVHFDERTPPLETATRAGRDLVKQLDFWSFVAGKPTGGFDAAWEAAAESRTRSPFAPGGDGAALALAFVGDIRQPWLRRARSLQPFYTPRNLPLIVAGVHRGLLTVVLCAPVDFVVGPALVQAIGAWLGDLCGESPLTPLRMEIAPARNSFGQDEGVTDRAFLPWRP